MKKMIALICAAVMTTSCAAASVGAIKISDFDYGTQRERLVKNLNVDMDRAASKLDNFTRQLENFSNSWDWRSGPGPYTESALKTLKELQQLLKDINKFKLCHDKLIETVNSNLRLFNYAFLDPMFNLNSSKDRARYVMEEYDRDTVISELEAIKCAVQFSTKLDDKRVELHQAGLFINKMDDSEEKLNLQKYYNEAQNYYNSIASTIELNSEGEEQAKKFFELSDRAINEIAKGNGSQKNDSINLAAPPLVEN